MAISQLEVGVKGKPFKGLSELPAYGRDPGWLTTCDNFRVMPEGYLQARGGFDAIKPSGGTTADPISAGIFTGAHEHTTADGYIWTFENTGSVYSANLAQRAYFEIWQAADFEVNDAVYIGSTVGTFSRVVFYIGQALVWTAAAGTFVYEYPTASDWSTTGSLTLTTTPTFTSTGEQVLEFNDPGAAWVKSVRNGVYGYFVRIRVSAVGGGVTTACWQSGTTNLVPSQKVYSDWQGNREIYVASANPASGTGNGTLKYYGQTSATAASWNSVSTTLWSGNYARTRFASYKNLLYFVNGKEQKRWDGNTLNNMGFTKPDLTGTAATPVVVGGSGLNSGVWLYAMTYGYGPNGEWGESSYTAIGTAAATIAAGTDGVQLDWTFNTTPGSEVGCLYLYRTQNLAAAQTTGQAAFPYYRFQTYYRNATGTLPSGVAAHTDSTLALPFPPVDLNVVTLTPPSRCKYICVHKNRLFLGSNNQYPGRVWWSETFQAEAFDTDENFADFTRSTGGQVTGIVEFNDQVVVFTEDQMFGISGVDQDVPSIYTIHPGIGCIAPDTVALGNGVLMWLARSGVYLWDGQDAPKRVTDQLPVTFGKMSYEAHGDSRAVIHNKMFDIRFCNPRSGGTYNSTILGYRYDLTTETWGRILTASAKQWLPLAVVTAPLAHADAGVRHPIYGGGISSSTDYSIYLGEHTTQDAGSNYVCKIRTNFGPTALREMTMHRAFAHYETNGSSGAVAGGWATPALSNANVGYIGDTPGAATNMTADSGGSHTRLSAVFAEGSLGTADNPIEFSATTNGAGESNGQRLLSIGVEVSGLVSGPWGQS